MSGMKKEALLLLLLHYERGCNERGIGLNLDCSVDGGDAKCPVDGEITNKNGTY